MPPTSRRVTAPDGVTLAVQEHGPAAAPTVVAVHGYPDNHQVWDGLVDALAGRFRVVTYDVRGAGDSDKPAAVADYRMARLVDDLRAVLETVSPAAPVHLVGHDWGSVQSWPALVDPRLAGRIAAFTSVSGPSLDYSAAWVRGLRRHPAAALRQLAHSYYIGLFQLPGLPELAIRRGLLDRALDPGVPRSAADKLNGLNLYRANVARRFRRPEPAPTTTPVQLVVPRDDAFVTPQLAIEAARPWVADLTIAEVPAGHWVVSEQPALVAELVRDFAR